MYGAMSVAYIVFNRFADVHAFTSQAILSVLLRFYPLSALHLAFSTVFLLKGLPAILKIFAIFDRVTGFKMSPMQVSMSP